MKKILGAALLALLMLGAAGAVAEEAVFVTGHRSITVTVGESIQLRKDEFSFIPEGSLFGGLSENDMAWSLRGDNGLFSGGCEIMSQTQDAFYAKALRPGYYAMMAYFYSDFGQIEGQPFLLTILDENGNKPNNPMGLWVFDIPSAVVGESVQISWYKTERTYFDRDQITVQRDDRTLAQWVYQETGEDTFAIDRAGEYIVTVTSTDPGGKTESASVSFRAVEPKPLELKSLTLDSLDSWDTLWWKLDYEGGRGTKESSAKLVYEINGIKVEEDVQQRAGFFPEGVVGIVDPGTYVLMMDVIDEDGAHTILSNAYIAADPDQLLPGDVNGDGSVDGRDLLRLARYLAGQGVTLDLALADVNRDGKVNGLDLLRLAKALAE